MVEQHRNMRVIVEEIALQPPGSGEAAVPDLHPAIGAKTATASNRLSKVAVRVRSSVSRMAEMRRVSVRSSAISSRPPSGMGWAAMRKWVPSESGHASS
jgi:hypothetical protein